jgi:hypothetical protein
MLTQFIKQGSHSFGFRFIISREKHFPMFGTFRGNIDAKFLHADITRARQTENSKDRRNTRVVESSDPVNYRWENGRIVRPD